MKDVLTIAKNCRHYAMCKIDFLGSGVCQSGLDKHYVSFYPQGRMDLYAAVVEGRIPITEKCVEIVESCDLCGMCDYQCYFVAEMVPSRVMKALKDYLSSYLNTGGQVLKVAEDRILRGIRSIVGDDWASNDLAITVTYSHDPCPVAVPKLPAYVVLPGSREEVSELMKYLSVNGIPYAVRGNGSSVMGLVMSEGVVIDLHRMSTIDFDEKNWLVRVGPGVSSFDLQQAAQKRGYRVNVAEPSALVCANMMCSGIFSTFSASYGTAADNYVYAEFVAVDGTCYSSNEFDAPNIFSFRKTGAASPGICTSVSMKLHPVTSDETGIMVPFGSLTKALDFSKECSIRRIGLAIGILGGEYISTFLAPTQKLAADVKEAFSQKLGIAYLVQVIGDTYSMNAVKAMGYPVIDQRLFRILYLGMPSLLSAPWLSLLEEFSRDDPFSYLSLSGFTDLTDTALAPSPELLSQEIDPKLRTFFTSLYSRPEMTDLVWLTMFRILSSRMGREKHVVAFIIYLPIDNNLVTEINTRFGEIADRYSLKNSFGFITPLDHGKRCVFEYDYYLDQNDPVEIERMKQAVQEAGEMIESYSASTGTVKWIRTILNQGVCRKENFLYI